MFGLEIILMIDECIIISMLYMALTCVTVRSLIASVGTVTGGTALCVYTLSPDTRVEAAGETLVHVWGKTSS